MRIRLTHEFTTGRYTGGSDTYRAIDTDTGRVLLTTYSAGDLTTALSAANLHPEDRNVYTHTSDDAAQAAVDGSIAPDPAADLGALLALLAESPVLAGLGGNPAEALHCIASQVTDRARKRVSDDGESYEVIEPPPGFAERAVQHALTPVVLPVAEPRYHLWTGGGTRALGLRGAFTAAELRRELLTDPGKGMVRREEVARALEAAIAAGSGSGSHGSFAHGTAAGHPVLSWRIELADDLSPADQRVTDRIADRLRSGRHLDR